MNNLIKNIIVEIKNVKDDICNIDFKKDITTNINFIIENFTEITGITIKSIVNVTTNIMFKIHSKLNIISKANINTIIGFAIKSNMVIDNKAEAKTNILFRENKKFAIDSNVISEVKREQLLEELDNLTLDEMDIQTLEQLDYVKGLRMIMQKKINIISNPTCASTLNLLMYYYNKLEDIDDLTLDDLDTLTLDEIDRVLI